MGLIKLKNGLCVKCNDGVLKPCIGKREKALCAARHYTESIRRSDSRKDEDKQLAVIKKAFLIESPVCMAKCCCSGNRAVDIHHKRGHGIYYLDTDTFLAVCRPCHRWIGDHPEEAIEKGFSELRLIKYDEVGINR